MPSTLPSVAAGTRLRASVVQAWIDEINAINLDTIRVVKGSDGSPKNNSSSLSDDPALTCSLLANSSYEFTFNVYSSSGSTPDIKFSVAFPAGAACTWGGQRLVSAATPTGDIDVGVYVAPSSGVSEIAAAGTGGDQLTVIKGTVVTAASAGSLTLRWAQNTATVSDTYVRARSSLVVHRVR